MMKRLRFLFLFLLICGTGIVVRAQAPGGDWVVPEPAKARVSPFRFTPDNINQGDLLFQRNCRACHGDPGKSNFAKIVPEPGDPASGKFQKQTDGEIFYRITTGKIPMPSFKSTLSEPERWSLISYIRSFNKSYKQPDTVQKGAFIPKDVRLQMSCDYKLKRIYVLCKEVIKDHPAKPLEGVNIQLSAVRYFGNLPLSGPKASGQDGLVVFDFPQNIPGDRNGYLTLLSEVNDDTGLLGDAEVKLSVKAGVPAQPVSLRADRAMWNTRDRAPVWIILVFSFSVIAVWGIIIYIVLALGKVRKIN
jgi:mono/diheme cytochrome c family protein